MQSIHSNYYQDTASALKYLDSADLLLKRNDCSHLQYKSDYLKASYFIYNENLIKASTYLIHSLNHQPTPNDPEYLLLTYRQLSYICTKLHQNKQAIFYINKSLALSQKTDTISILGYDYMLAANYLNLKDTVKAYQYFRDAYNYAQYENYNYSLANACQNIASLMLYQQKYDSAHYYSDMSFKYAYLDETTPQMIPYYYLIKCNIFALQHKMDSCAHYFSLIKPDFPNTEIDYDKLGSYYEMSYIINKYRKNNTDALAALEHKNKLDTKHFEQTKDDQLQNYEIELKELNDAKYLHEKNAQIQLREYFMLLYVVVSILLAFVVYFAFKFFKKRKNNEILHLLHQKQVLEIETQKSLLQAQISERNRIAHEMHDDLGSSLTSVSMAVEMFNQNPSNTKSIQTINQSIGNLHQQVNEIVWSLNMRNDKIQNLLAYIHRFARNFLEEAHISLHWEESDDFKNIPIEGIVRRTLYLSSKELLNNIVKHAEARNVWISASIEQNEMQLIIKDDGKGFDLSKVDTVEGNGNGLKNLQQNIQLINGTIAWENENGTIVIIKVYYNI